MYQHQPPPLPAAAPDWMVAYADMEPANVDALLMSGDSDLDMAEFPSVNQMENTAAFFAASTASSAQTVSMPLSHPGFYWTPSPAEDMYVDSDDGKSTGFPLLPSSLPPPTLFEAIRSTSEAIHDPASLPMVKLQNGQTLRVCASAAVMRELARPDVSDIRKAQKQVQEQLQMHGIVQRKQEPIVVTATNAYPQPPPFPTSGAPAEFDPYEGSCLDLVGAASMDCLTVSDRSPQSLQSEAICEDGTMAVSITDGGRRKTTQAAMLENFVTHRDLRMINVNSGGSGGLDRGLDNGLGGTLDGFVSLNEPGNHGFFGDFTADRVINNPAEHCGRESNNTSTTATSQCSSYLPTTSISDTYVSAPASNLSIASSSPTDSANMDSLDREEHKTMLFHTLVHNYWKTHGLDSCAAAMEEARVPILAAEYLHRVGVFDGRATASTMVMWWFGLFCELFGLDKSEKALIEQYKWMHENFAKERADSSPCYEQKRLPDEYDAIPYKNRRSKSFAAKYPQVLVPIAPAPTAAPASAPSSAPFPAPTKTLPPELVQKSALGNASPTSTPPKISTSDFIARATRDTALMLPPQRPTEAAITAAVAETTSQPPMPSTAPHCRFEDGESPRAQKTSPIDQRQQEPMHAGQPEQMHPQLSLPRPAYNSTDVSYNDISTVDSLSLKFMLLERKNKQIVREAGERDNQMQAAQQQRQWQLKHP